MGCDYSVDRGVHSTATGHVNLSVGDRVAVEVERCMESQRFPGTMCMRRETDVGTIRSIKNKSYTKGSAGGLGMGSYRHVVDCHVFFAHGGNLHAQHSQLRRPSEEDEASAAACLARLGPKQSTESR